MEISERISNELSTPERVAAFERRLGDKLPPAYHRFLLEVNGGRPVKRRFSFIENGKKTESAVDWFFGDSDDTDYGLTANLDVYKDRIPKSFLPIATDPFGNLLLLSLRGNDFGAIFFWNHELEDTSTNLLPVSKSFDAFLAGLS